MINIAMLAALISATPAGDAARVNLDNYGACISRCRGLADQGRMTEYGRCMRACEREYGQ